jgi:hypothetical protein
LAAVADITKVAVPLFTVPVPSVVVPALNVTVPVPAGTIVAVSVVELPRATEAGEAVTVVVVGATTLSVPVPVEAV